MIRLIIDFLLGCVLVAAIGPAQAELRPARGKLDPRVRTVAFNESDIVRLTTFFGVSTHIQLAAGEIVIDHVSGDDEAWTLVTHANHMYLKPRARHADTNLTVVTNRRTYHFLLVLAARSESDPKAWLDPDLVYSLVFTYADSDGAPRQRIGPVVVNENYWAAGARDLWPRSASDDGQFVRLAFAADQTVPSVFERFPDGREAAVPVHMEGSTLVVHRLVRHLVLKRGGEQACIVNRTVTDRSPTNSLF